MKLYYYYDVEADIMYFSKGKPSRRTISQEAADDIVLRIDPKKKGLVGFTILNFTKRLKRQRFPIELPIKAELLPA